MPAWVRCRCLSNINIQCSSLASGLVACCLCLLLGICAVLAHSWSLVNAPGTQDVSCSLHCAASRGLDVCQARRREHRHTGQLGAEESGRGLA